MRHPFHRKMGQTKKRHIEPFDYLIYFFAFTTPLFEVPQAVLVYGRQDATGVSIFTWGFFALSSLAWVLYGIHKNMRLIIVAHALYLFVETIIVIGIVRYS